MQFKDLAADFKKFVSAFPAGTYITVLSFWDKSDDNVLTLKYAQDVISRDRNEFR